MTLKMSLPILLSVLFMGAPALASSANKSHSKGVKIGQHLGPARVAKLRKWAKNERIRRKQFNQYFSGKKSG